MSYAQVALDKEVIDAPISNERIKGLETTRVIFFAGDAIPPHEKYEMPNVKGAGGVYLPHIRTMPQGEHQASRGMLYQCKFTPLTTKMRPEWNMMLSPDARQNWEKEFTQTVVENGQSKTKHVKGFMQSVPSATKRGRFEVEESDHLVFNKRYPGQDIRMATERTPGNGVGGVVEITALAGATAVEIAEAQYFFFPNWDAIAMGAETLPSSLADVEAHIQGRIRAIPTQDWHLEKKTKFQSIGRDIMRSISEFRRTGTALIEKDEKAFKAASKDDSQGYSPLSTHLLGQLGIQRKNDLLAGDHQALNRFADVMERKERGNDELERQKLILEERKQYVAELNAGLRERDLDEEVRLGMRKTAEPKVRVEPPVTDPIDEVYLAPEPVDIVESPADVLCGAPTVNGTCARTATENGKCWQHK